MKDVIMIGADVHDSKIVMQYAEGRGKPQSMWCKNCAAGRAAFIKKGSSAESVGCPQFE